MSSTGTESSRNTTPIVPQEDGHYVGDIDPSEKCSRDQFNCSTLCNHGQIPEIGEEMRVEGSSTAAAVGVVDAMEESACQQQRELCWFSSLEKPGTGEDGLCVDSARHSISTEIPAQKMAWLEYQRKKAAACEEEGDLLFAMALLKDSLPVALQAVEEGVCDASLLGQHLTELANVCYQLGDTDEAIGYYTNSIKQERRALVHEHHRSPSYKLQARHYHRLLHSMGAICRIYIEEQQYSYALTQFKELYDIQLEISGPNSLEVASTLCDLGHMHYMLRNYQPSLHFYHEALRIRMNILECFKSGNVDTAPSRHLLEKSIGDCLNAMGLLYAKLGRVDAASSAFKCSLMVRENVLGLYHRDVTVIWYNLAMVRLQACDEGRAITLYREGLRRECIGLGDAFHPDLSLKLQYLGEMHKQAGVLDDSLVCFQRALQIEYQAALRLKKTDHPRPPLRDSHLASVCRLLNVIGNIHLMQEDISAAMASFIQAARTDTKLRQTPHSPLVATGYMLLRLHPKSAAAA